jgi:ribonuclease HI
MYFNGSYTLKGAGAGVVLIPPEGDMLKYVIQIEFPATNNTAEYRGLVIGLRLAKGSAFGDFSSKETLSSWQNKYKNSTAATTIRWQNIWQKCEEWRSFLWL